MRSRDAEAGFSLIEVLTSLAITAAFVAVVLPFAVTLAAEWSRGERNVESADGWLQGVARLSDDLSEAVPLSLSQGHVEDSRFTASPHLLEFARPALGRPGALRLERVRYEIVQSASGSSLVRTAREIGHEGAKEPDSVTTILEGPCSFQFRIFGQDRVPLMVWSDADIMPEAVEFAFVGRRPRTIPMGRMILPIVAKSARGS